MRINSNAISILRHRDIIRNSISNLISTGEDYAIVDFPNHSNVGDSAIWLGEVILLKEITGKQPRYICDYKNFNADTLQSLHPTGTIFIHGGGNLGDIWHAHQNFRKFIIRQFPNRRIIQLPQTIHFQNKKNCDEFTRIVENHKDIHLFVRDKNSELFAKANFNIPVTLTPDAAFGMGNLQQPLRLLKTFILLRTDQEKTGFDFSPLLSLPNSASGDWLDEPPDFHKKSKYQSILFGFPKTLHSAHSRRMAIFHILASGRLKRGLRMISQGEILITDRLHAHILSVLIGQPNIALDNNYGKIHGYIESWTKSFNDVFIANSADEAFIHHKEIIINAWQQSL